jgi:hypothetical protein
MPAVIAAKPGKSGNRVSTGQKPLELSFDKTRQTSTGAFHRRPQPANPLGDKPTQQGIGTMANIQ